MPEALALRGIPVGRPTLYVAALGAVTWVACYLFLARPQEWWGSPWAALGCAASACLLLAPLAAGASAWLTSRSRAWGTTHLARGGGLREAGAVVAWTWAPIGVAWMAVAVAAVGAALVRAGGWLDASWPTAALVTLAVVATPLAWAAMGALLGRRLPPMLAAAGAALLPLVTHAALTAAVSREGVASLFFDSELWLTSRPTLARAVCCALAWLGLALAACLALSGTGPRPRAGGLVASLGVAGALFTGAHQQPILGGDVLVCSPETAARPVQVCVERAVAPSLHAFSEAVGSTFAALPPIAAADVERVLSSSPRQPGDLEYHPMTGRLLGGLVIDDDRVVNDLGARLLTAGCSSSARLPELLVWWRLHRGEPLDQQRFPGDTKWTAMPEAAPAIARARAIEALDEAGRQAWFEANARALHSCRPDDVRWPAR